jgi:hypothetical protein
MRIATWNIERCRRGKRFTAAYDDEIENLCAGVVVVTEPGPGFAARHPEAILSPQRRSGPNGTESWVAIVGDAIQRVDTTYEYRDLAVACRCELSDASLVVFGSVLPWLAAGSQAPDVYGPEPRTFIDIFREALSAQVGQLRQLASRYPDDLLIWAGDFNHPLQPPFISAQASDLLRGAIAGLGLQAMNLMAPHREPGLCALDLICAPSETNCQEVESYCPTFDGHPLSDHRAYVVELEVASRNRTH